MSSADTPERKARFLVIPSLLLAVAGVTLLPWLLETRRRLDNVYWEGQLLFAIVALCIALCGVPFVCLRLFHRVWVISPLGWLVTALGYLCLLMYLLQSHFPITPKLIFALLGLVCLRWALQGFRLDMPSIHTHKA
jgi:membrane-associated HD superfamily phosphohydrolase